jgi:uncharacterized membrane protein
MNTHNWLRLIHILTGVFWAGTAIFLAVILVPAIRAVGPQGGPVMRELMENRKMPIVLMASALFTIVSGSVLAWRDAGALGFRWFESGAGLGFGLGAVAGVAALLTGLGVNMPTSKKMSALLTQLQGRAPNEQEAAQIRKLQNRLSLGTRLIAILVLIATAFMATARNFGAA